MTRSGARVRATVTALAVAVWLAAMAVPPAVLLRSRDSWLGEFARPEARSDWDAFRHDMKRQSGRDGPVQRKVPRSVEPPALVWLRDYFALAVTAWLLFTGVLGGFFCLLVAGALGPARSGPGASLPEDQAGRHHDPDQQHERDAQNTQ